MPTRSYLLPTVLLSLSGLGASCWNSAPKATGRTLVLVTVEGLRADHGTLRSIDGARTFDDVLSVAPMARPAVATILSGVPPDRSEVRDNVADRLSADVRTLPQALKSAGWSTGAFVGSPSCGWTSGFEAGFGTFDAPPPQVVGPGRFLPKPRPAEDVAANAVTWLDALPAGARAFAWIHLADLPSIPFSLDVEWAKSPQVYAEAIPAIDAAIGTVLAAARRRGELEVLVVGTHGMYFGEGEKYGDSFWLDKTTLHVPLVWLGGRSRKGADDREAWLPDVAATLAASAGESLGPASEGADLGAPAVTGRKRFAWTWAPDDQAAWPTLAVVATGRTIEPSTERPATPRPRELSPALRQRIEAAGVKLGEEPKVWKAFPKGSEIITYRYGRARYLMSIGRDGPAGVTARLGLKDYPEDFGLLTTHLFVEWQGAKAPRVKATIDKLLKLYPDRQEALHWVAHSEYAQGHAERSEALTLAAAAIGPRDADILYDLACARAVAKDLPASLDYLKQALEAGFRDWSWIDKDPDLAALRSDPGYAALRRAGGQ